MPLHYHDILYLPYTTIYSSESYQHPGKRVKIEPSSLFPDTSNSNAARDMQRNELQQLNLPHINVQTASTSSSPISVATSISNRSTSTPSRSPSRVSILSNTSTPERILFDESLGSLGQEHKVSPSPQHSHPVSQPPIFSSRLQMETAFPNSYYAGYPTDFSKLSHQQYLAPFTSAYQNIPHNHTVPYHTTEDEPPALSPSNQYSSSRQQSVYEGDLRSPLTPVGSPMSNDGDRTSSIGTPVNREDTYVSIYDECLGEDLHFPLMLDIHNPVPKFTRTVSDAAEDELYTSNMEAPKLQHHSSQRSNSSATSSMPVLTTFYQKAQSDHAMEARKPSSNQLNVRRGDSPFRANSPYHPMRTTQPVVSVPIRHSNFPPYITFQSQRERQKELETQSMNDHMMAEVEQIVSTPKTISPKDSVLEYPEPDDDASKISLFTADQHFGYVNESASLPSETSYNRATAADDQSYDLESSRKGSEAGVLSFHQQCPQMPILPSNFPYHTQSLEPSSVNASTMGGENYAKSSSPIIKPEGTKAETGAYTCTAPGCLQRFTTTQKLQKHRREHHRQPTYMGSAGMTSALHGSFSNRHQGPHKCTRINPTTGKPCNTIFSRPYDLTRHEDTIHNTSREKVRCEICNDEKTFSRQDALTRHKKVKHGIDK
jgi:hypothetical protein